MITKVKSGGQFVFELLYASSREYSIDRVSRMSAAVAYRALFALTPLFIISVGALGVFLGSDQEAQAQIYAAIDRVAGAEIADAFETFMGTAFVGSGSATVVGLVLLLWTTSSLFNEIQNDLNDIFHVPYERTAGPIEFIKKRGLGFLWGLGVGILVLVVWVINVVWSLFGQFFIDRDLQRLHQVVDAVAPLVTLIVLPVLFALLYQSLTAVRIRRRALFYGAIFTSVGFVVAGWATGVYFRWETDTSAATVAGSLFVIILVAYVLAGVFLFGSVMMKVGHDYLREGDVMTPTERHSEALAEAIKADVVVAEPPAPVAVSAVVGFLAGLAVGWRRSRR